MAWQRGSDPPDVFEPALEDAVGQDGDASIVLSDVGPQVAPLSCIRTSRVNRHRLIRMVV